MPTMSLGIRSGVNCTRRNVELERLPERAHEQRLAQARHAFEQAVAAGEQADEQLLDDGFLPDDDASDRRAHLRELLELPLDVCFARRACAASSFMSSIVRSLCRTP